MKSRRYRYAELGMLLGMFVGGGIGVVLFATTGEATYFSFIGIGLALGIGLGAAFDGAKDSSHEGNDESAVEDK